MRLTRGSAFLGLLIVLACTGRERGDELSERFPGTHFAALNNVSLGMSADALKKARPNAKLSPYSGFAEQLDGGGVAYGFPTGAVWKNELVDLIARLEWVTHSQGAGSGAEARLVWRNSVNAAIREIGQPAKCEQIKGRSPGARAVWEAGDAWLEIAVRAGFQTGNGALPDRVLTTASTGDDPARPTDLVAADCASLLANTAARSS